MLRLMMLASLLVMGAMLPARAQDAAGAKDHPMLTRYPASVIKWYDVQAYMPYRIAVGAVTGYRKIDEWIDTQGQVTRINYELIGERTHGDVYENYKKALSDAGFAIIADGYLPQVSQANDIGSRKWMGLQYGANEIPPSAGVSFLEGSATAGGTAFISAKKERDAGTAFVAIGIAQQRADRVSYVIDVIEVAAAETGLVVIDAEAMGEDIDEYGKVALYGLQFEHDKATLMPESKPALDEIAKLLAARPDLLVYVVGHTDSTGKLDYNVKLSQARAQSVVTALVEDYGIAAERLAPHGVGPLVPVFTNGSDGGRAKNRRVELVQR